MTEEKIEVNLSEKIIDEKMPKEFHKLFVEDVKEAVRLLKEDLHEELDFVVGCAACKNNIDEIIDKRVGDKLKGDKK